MGGRVSNRGTPSAILRYTPLLLPTSSVSCIPFLPCLCFLLVILVLSLLLVRVPFSFSSLPVSFSLQPPRSFPHQPFPFRSPFFLSIISPFHLLRTPRVLLHFFARRARTRDVNRSKVAMANLRTVTNTIWGRLFFSSIGWLHAVHPPQR